ncbi:cytochrome b5 [Auriscalpium vulgare]|uniref:Cytochrome b5 n=1 Tax=Auriscalpium vulgare TaxID=40419 RepID=A0ACB8RSH8_9AGAM|nr:cytochrome b5 [Auriscalpium vulgare]
MASYLRSWLAIPTATVAQPQSDPDSPTTPTKAPEFTFTEPQIDDDELLDEDDVAPAFPAPNSAQRAAGSSAPSLLPPSTLMPPPPLPGPRRPGPPAPSSNSLMPPPTTTKAPKSAKKSGKVALAPGHSPLDWAALKSSGTDLRGGLTGLLRIPPSVLKMHNKPDDAWSAFQGKVYNITPYLDFHPGGRRELLRVAGRDGTNLFAKTHAWVNVDFMLDECLVGFLVSEPSS